MQQALPLLIERALSARDQQSARLAQAHQAVQQAQATLERLQAFRRECLARSPGAHQGRTDGQALAGHQGFLSRLDEAIALQLQERSRRQAHAASQQALLAQCQQRLLAFETLHTREAQRRELRSQRRAQRESDEFAARAFARRQESHA